MAENKCTYKCGVWNCGSYQFNLHQDDIDQGNFCDVHYWQTKAQRPWVKLTDEEIMEIMGYDKQYGYIPLYSRNFVEAITAKLMEKNT